MTKRPTVRGVGDAQGLQTVFRVRGSKAREKTASQDGPQKASFNARRSHKKSRTGCQNCKQRRVKCDETRVGGCLKCRNHGIDCDYLDLSMANEEDIADSSDYTTPTSVSQSNSNPSSAVMTPVTTEVTAVTPYIRPPTPLLYDVPLGMTPYWQTLHHFETFTCPTITSPDGLRIFETSVLAIANQSDYLMHAVLGTAAAHLAWKANACDSFAEYRKHRRTEAYHWQKALSMFRSRLDTLEQRTSETVDALISTCMLLGIHSYLLSDEKDGSSFVWRSDDDRPEALRWLSVQSGFGLLLRTLGGRAALSVWLNVFQSAVPGEGGLREDLDTPQEIYPDFLDLCAIDEFSTPEDNPYLVAIRDLFALLQMGPPTMANFAQLMAFMGRLVGPFQRLLIERDHAAMLVVGYWLALMFQLQLWWIQDRAKSECTAILTYLKRSSDVRIQRLLVFPATIMDTSLLNS